MEGQGDENRWGLSNHLDEHGEAWGQELRWGQIDGMRRYSWDRMRKTW